MGKIDELIKQLCPNGIEYHPIGDIMYISDYVSAGSFAAIKKNVQYLAEENYAILLRFADFTAGFNRDKFVYINEHAYNFLSKSNIKPGDIIMSNVGSCGSLFVCPDLGKPMSLAPNSIVIRTNNNNFYYHWFSSYVAQKKIENITSKSAMPKFNKTKLKKILAPLPPLAVQKEIVEILDTFTGMIDNLQRELEQRQKQFEHHRDQMLTFKEGEVQMKPIKEIGKLVRGNGLQKKDFTEDGTGCIHYGQIYTRFGLSTSSTLTFVDSQLAAKLTKVSPGDLVIACTSENIEDVCKSVAWLGKEDIVTGGHACVFKHSENPKYIAYCFTTSAFFLQKRKYAYGAKVIDIKTEKLGEITLPIPSLEKQQEIVDKLDTFESLISNIKQEIELRQKQYEYYREKLLTFE